MQLQDGAIIKKTKTILFISQDKKKTPTLDEDSEVESREKQNNRKSKCNI